MNTITIPKNEYKRLKQYSYAYLKIVEEITKAESAYPYDKEYIKSLNRQTLKNFKGGKCIEAESIDEALAKFKTR